MLGRAVGYALLGLVDALIPAAITVSLVYGVTLYLSGPVSYLLPVGAGALVLVVGFVAGAVSARRGGKPFPVTRAAIRIWKRLWWV